MKKYITLKKDFNVKLNSKITKHSNPKYIYLPIPKEDKIHSSIEVKKEEKLSDFLISPVSGKIVGMKYCQMPNGNVEKCLTILNDYKESMMERKAVRKNIAKISKEEMLNELKDYHLEHIASKIEKKDPNGPLILNGIEDEPYVANEIFVGKEYTSLILETFDAIREILSCQIARIIVKSSDRENIEAYTNLLGTYPNIELVIVPDYYLLGEETYIKEYLHLPNSSIMLRPSEVYQMNNTMKRKRHTLDQIFTISGDGIENPQVIEAKIGSAVIDIIKEHIKKKKDQKTVCYINGLMKGQIMDPETLIVTPDLTSILFMKETNLQEEECINCGKCYTVCPKGCNPRAFLETKKTKTIKNCIDCGLCSYICPSFINLRQRMKGDQNE